VEKKLRREQAGRPDQQKEKEANDENMVDFFGPQDQKKNLGRIKVQKTASPGDLSRKKPSEPAAGTKVTTGVRSSKRGPR